MNGHIPSSPAWCSYCLVPESYGLPPGPCDDHRGPDGQAVEYTGRDAYQPSQWVLDVVGRRFTTGDWSGRSRGPLVYRCIGYDPRNGFWMQRVDQPEDRRSVSERAIGRTYHEVRMTYGAWILLEMAERLGRMPTREESEAERPSLMLELATKTLRQNGLVTEDGDMTPLAHATLRMYPEGERYHVMRIEK